MVRKMDVPERNRAIKRELAKVFGWKNVKVRGERGTAYGWVNITVYVPDNPEWDEDDRRKKYDEVRDKIIDILQESGLWDEIGEYYPDDLYYTPQKRMSIQIEFVEGLEEPKKTTAHPVEEVKAGDGYKVVYEGSWTWVYFEEKPPEEVREKLKAQGFRFSRRRVAWFKPEKVTVEL